MTFVISWFLKISQHVSQISLWWISKNQKSEIYICFVFSCWSSWDDFDLPYLTVSGGKIAQKMGNFLIFPNFMIFENLSTYFANISVMNFQKSKIWDVHFLRFFHADRHEMLFICHMLLFLVEKWPRKWGIFFFS